MKILKVLKNLFKSRKTKRREKKEIQNNNDAANLYFLDKALSYHLKTIGIEE